MAIQYAEKVQKSVLDIANGCQGLELPFCSAECPMHTDVLGYVKLIGEGKLDEAVRKIREAVFLPATLGRVCAHPCETVCRRESEFKQPIAVAALKRYAADKADREELWDISVPASTGKRVAIVGSGPAGAQAAVDLRKMGHHVTIYERLMVLGGMMRVGIPKYRLPSEVLDSEYSYLNKLGVEFKLGVEVGKDVSLAALRESHDAVIIANGAHLSAKPKIAGDDCAGLTSAVDFLREITLTQKSTIMGKNVLVIGGGDVAIDCARSALRLGAEQAALLSLEQQDVLPASKHEQEGALEEGVRFYCGWCADKIISTNGRVSALRLKNCLEVVDSVGCFNPIFGEEAGEISCDTVIFATGQVVEDVTAGTLEQTKGGRFVTDKETLSTALPGVFVAGDAAGGTIVIEAMALGRKAARSADRYLKNQDLKAGRNFKTEYSFESHFDVPLPLGTADVKRHATQMVPAGQRLTSFMECDLGLTDEDANAEATRCLVCECSKCMKECLMLNDYTRCPGELFAGFIATGDMDAIIPYSCNLCNQCTLVCPEEYKLAEIFAGMRKDIVKANKGKSPLKGHGAIDIHQKLSFSRMFTVKRKGGK